jgi:exosome complex exonuclease DIS3/RRP44
LKSEPLYDDHQSFDEMVLGIREGKFFKGRLNVSRVNLEEATVTVEGLTDDIVVMGMRNQNRALNGDIVCL